jgi:hypothetical protein
MIFSGERQLTGIVVLVRPVQTEFTGTADTREM